MSFESSLFVRLYLDEDVHKRVAPALRMRNFDVVSAHELRRWSFSDAEQMAFAVSEQRTIFTFNTGDYVRLYSRWLSESRHHYGIIVSDQLTPGDTIRRLLHLLNWLTADEARNQLYFLQAFK